MTVRRAQLAAGVTTLGLVLLAIVVLAGADKPAAEATRSTRSSPFVGHSWQLVRVIDGYGKLELPSSTGAHLAFAHDGQLSGDDTQNGIGARFRLTPSGYTTTGPVTIGGVGYAGSARTRTARTIGAIDACFFGPAKAASVRRGRLVVRAGRHVLTFVRAGPPQHSG